MLSEVDSLFLLDVYAAGETPLPTADSKSLARSIRQRGQVEPVYVSEPGKLAELLASQLQDNDMVITQGAGSIGAVAKNLADHDLLHVNKQDEGAK